MAYKPHLNVLNSGSPKELAENCHPLPPESQRIHANANIIFGFALTVN
jgi:hypothetical protein